MNIFKNGTTTITKNIFKNGTTTITKKTQGFNSLYLLTLFKKIHSKCEQD